MRNKKKQKQTILACGVCSERNYSTAKSAGQQTVRLELKKYCRRCIAHTAHRETR